MSLVSIPRINLAALKLCMETLAPKRGHRTGCRLVTNAFWKDLCCENFAGWKMKARGPGICQFRAGEDQLRTRERLENKKKRGISRALIYFPRTLTQAPG
jgi:hypothetical protein